MAASTGPTLTPHFRDFLPSWIALQPWYPGDDVPSIRPVGFFRLEDPAGEVGIETHLVSAGSAIFQIPMTYRGAPLEQLRDGSPAAESHALITRAEHSELGARWIYDAVHDPVWAAELVRLVATQGTVATRSTFAGPAPSVRGVRYRTWQATIEPDIELRRVIAAGPPAEGPDVLGAVIGGWHPGAGVSPVVEGCLAILKDPSARHA